MPRRAAQACVAMGLLGLAECTMSRAMLEEDRCLVLTLIGAGNEMICTRVSFVGM